MWHATRRSAWRSHLWHGKSLCRCRRLFGKAHRHSLIFCSVTACGQGTYGAAAVASAATTTRGHYVCYQAKMLLLLVGLQRYCSRQGQARRDLCLMGLGQDTPTADLPNSQVGNKDQVFTYIIDHLLDRLLCMLCQIPRTVASCNSSPLTISHATTISE